MKRSFLIATLAALSICSINIATAYNKIQEQDARLRAAKAWMNFQMRDQFAPGASVALVHDQKVVWSHAYGYANIADKQAMTTDHAYSICSISKLFTSIGVMTLVDQGKVNLDSPLAEYLEGFALESTEETRSSPITVRQLLSHSAGLPRETSGSHWNMINDMPSSDEVFAMLNEQQRLYSPHANFQYSNLGMSLLGKLITEVSGQNYHDYIKAKILSPLKLTGVSSELPMDYDNGRFAVGYKYHAGKADRAIWQPYQMRGYAPAAGYAASVMDLAQFATWHFRLLETGTKEVLAPDTLTEMLRVQFTDPFDPNSPKVGLGYFFRSLGGKMAFGHGGYCPGYRAQFLVRPKDKLALIGMVNTNDVNPAAMINGIADIAADSVIAASSQQSNESSEQTHDFFQYEGRFAWPGYDSETYVIPSSSGIVVIDLVDPNAGKNATSYTHVKGDVFRRKRDEGDLGETLTFLRDDSGNIAKYSSHGFVIMKQK